MNISSMPRSGADSTNVADSLERNVRRLASSHACLNFIRRASGETSMVDRTSDALCLRQILVQESSLEVRPYLSPWEHFLQFSTLEELDELCAVLKADINAFEKTRQSGVDYFDLHYCDTALLRYVATWCA